MPSTVFAVLARSASAAVDAVMAEGWTLQPRKAPGDRNVADVADPARPATAFVATFVDPEAKAADLANSYDRRQVRRPGEESGHPRLLVSPAVRAALALEIVAGDLLTRSADGVAWKVSTVFLMAGGTLKLGINVVG